MAKHNCENCKFRAIYDKKPQSLLGRLWKWHIGWCPGWNKYKNALSEEERDVLNKKYGLKA